MHDSYAITEFSSSAVSSLKLYFRTSRYHRWYLLACDVTEVRGDLDYDEPRINSGAVGLESEIKLLGLDELGSVVRLWAQQSHFRHQQSVLMYCK